jgi:hypothetical protein
MSLSLGVFHPRSAALVGLPVSHHNPHLLQPQSLTTLISYNPHLLTTLIHFVSTIEIAPRKNRQEDDTDFTALWRRASCVGSVLLLRNSVAVESRFLLMPIALFLVRVGQGQHDALSAGCSSNLEPDRQASF